jgi:hypothetical protein
MHDAMYIHVDVEAGIPADVKINSAVLADLQENSSEPALHIYQIFTNYLPKGKSVLPYCKKISYNCGLGRFRCVQRTSWYEEHPKTP